jgi:hypothetical protein
LIQRGMAGRGGASAEMWWCDVVHAIRVCLLRLRGYAEMDLFPDRHAVVAGGEPRAGRTEPGYVAFSNWCDA